MNRYELLASLRASTEFLKTCSGNASRRTLDMETSRVVALCRLQGAERPYLPRVASTYAETGRINSVADLKELSAQLGEHLTAAREDPESYDVIWTTREDEVEEVRE